MGAFFSNFQVYCGTAQPKALLHQVADAIRAYMDQSGYEPISDGSTADRTILLTQAGSSPWITCFDEEIDGEIEQMDPCGSHLSAATGQPVLGIAVLDSDLACMHLYEGGAVKERLASNRKRKRLPNWQRFFSPPGLGGQSR